MAGHLLNRQEAAELLGVQAATLATWKCTKRYGLKYVRIGRHIKYRREDIDEFIKDRTVDPRATPDPGRQQTAHERAQSIRQQAGIL